MLDHGWWRGYVELQPDECCGHASPAPPTGGFPSVFHSLIYIADKAGERQTYTTTDSQQAWDQANQKQ